MCGIASIVFLDPSNPPREVNSAIESMVCSMKYRGPDAQGTFLDHNLGALGHVRLSIIATGSESNQPFHSTSGRSCISFNGEIYNYVELRSELAKSHGVQFSTNSDTEVLLAAYEVWGDECVKRFNGMWAFVIFDFINNRVFCSRDRFGVKPFLLAVDGNALYIASEAKAILAVNDRFRKPNFKALSLLLRASVGGQNLDTCFEGITRLPPAHNLVIENGKVRSQRYWDYPCHTQNGAIPSFEDASDQLRTLLSDAVRVRMRSDVPVGFTLSGGLDSSAIVTLAGELGFSGLKAYTATYTHDSYQSDESAMARLVARRAGMELVPVEIESSDLLPLMRKSIYHLEGPHAAMPILPYGKIMERARQDVTVLLEGQGSDELLGGYPNTLGWATIRDCANSANIGDAAKFLSHSLKGHYGSSGLSAVLLMCRTNLRMPGLHRLFRAARGDEGVYQGPLRLQRDDQHQVRDYRFAGDHVNSELQLQHENGLVNLLQYGDAITMAHSIEGRLPFMDYRLVEFASGLPGSYKLRGGFSKAVFRHAMHNKLPQSLLADRKKRGFDTPIAKWFGEQSREIVEPVLFSKACRERGLFDLQKIRKLLQKHEQGAVDLVSQIYRWTITELWFQQFIDNPFVPASDG